MTTQGYVHDHAVVSASQVKPSNVACLALVHQQEVTAEQQSGPVCITQFPITVTMERSQLCATEAPRTTGLNGATMTLRLGDPPRNRNRVCCYGEGEADSAPWGYVSPMFVSIIRKLLAISGVTVSAKLLDVDQARRRYQEAAAPPPVPAPPPPPPLPRTRSQARSEPGRRSHSADAAVSPRPPVETVPVDTTVNVEVTVEAAATPKLVSLVSHLLRVGGKAAVAPKPGVGVLVRTQCNL